jgi:hypothetical protein
MTPAPHKDRAHAKLAPSASERWMMCPGSVKASEGVPDRGSVFAAEGTAAHELAEHCLSTGFDADRFIGQIVDTAATGKQKAVRPGEADGKTTFEIDDDMAEAVQVYLDFCRGEIADGDEYDIEQRLDMTAIHPEIFGTGDFLRYRPSDKSLLVVDYKHGRGVAVDPQSNAQLLTYAIGAALRYHNRGLATVELVVVQPRCPHRDGPVRRWSIDALDLFDWSEDLKTAAYATEADDAPLVTGEHCTFCKAAPLCPALHARAVEAAELDFDPIMEELRVADPATYEPEKLAHRLREVDAVENWCRRVREFAHHEMEAGRKVPGFKLVAKRPVRRWKDDEQAKTALLEYGCDEKDIYTEPKMKSPAQMEKVVGAKNKKDIADLWASVSGGHVVAPEDDPRPPVKAEAEEDFSPLD